MLVRRTGFSAAAPDEPLFDDARVTTFANCETTCEDRRE